MLYLNDGTTERQILEPRPHIASDAVWVDLLNPNDAERAAAERVTGLRVPSRNEISEIENSSRVFTEEDRIFLSMPATVLGSDGHSHVTPVGFVLSNTRLLTLRFETLSVFDMFSEGFCHKGRVGSYEVFVGLAEMIVDRLADSLERVGADLGQLSKRTFRSGDQSQSRNARRSDAELRAILTAVGLSADALSDLRDSVLGIGRITSYVQQAGDQTKSPELATRLKTLRDDIASLNDYDQQLHGKVNFLLDAALGFISIEQNNGVKVLTIASVVGIPPTFVVGLYGMNFKNMPEYNWTYGYEFGWAMIFLSIVIPLIWFRRRGWL